MGKRRVDGGRFYARDPQGRMHEVPAAALDGVAPDIWICRRLADYPHGVAPPGAATSQCARCDAPIAYNPARILAVPRTTPQVCMQCAGITPLPIP